MDGYGAATYGDGFADVYDDWYATLGDGGAAVAKLAELAGGPGPGVGILELGVGTGRLAIPLARLGFDVWGIDASAAMLDRLRAKPGGERVHAVAGDMADIGPGVGGLGVGGLGDRRFALVFAAFNTFFNLTSGADQARCLTGAAGRLAPSGRLVIEAFVPSDTPPAPGGVVEVGRIEADRVVLTLSRTRPDDQVVEGQHVELSSSGVRLRPWSIRYLTPDQLDDMAGAAGLSLIHRWAGWRDEPFDDSSPAHVSVYGVRLPADSER